MAASSTAPRVVVAAVGVSVTAHGLMLTAAVVDDHDEPGGGARR